MKRQTLITLGATVVGFAALVSAQTVNLDIHRGYVQIRSTASNALAVLGGARLSGNLVIGSQTALSGSQLELQSNGDGIGNAGIAIRRADGSYLILNMDDGGSSAYASIQAGDGGTFRPIRLNPSGSVVLLPNGSVSAPAIAFGNEATSGFYWDNLASGGFNAAVGSVKAARFSAGNLEIPTWAGGTGGVPGARLIIGRNSSGGGAPGQAWFTDKNNALWVVHPDSTGVLRIGGNAVTEAGGDTVGTVVGAQTSTRASKDILRRVTETALAMQTIRDTPVYEFRYKNGAFNGETFTGIVTDDSPMFGMDRGKSFNPVSAFGASVLALQDLDARVRELEARLRSLEARR